MSDTRSHCDSINETTLDRRQCERLRAPDDVFLTCRPTFEKIGNVKDISKTGVSFEYVVFGKIEGMEHPECGYAEVDIFSRSSGLYISRMFCDVVYDVTKDASFLLRNTETRRCGLKFGPLTEQQVTKLSEFLDGLR